MHCIAIHEREAVQFMCLLLYYGGVLQPYTKGNKTCGIDTKCDGLDGQVRSIAGIQKEMMMIPHAFLLN